MEASTSEATGALFGPLAWATLAAAAVAALLIIYYLARRPPLTSAIKLLLAAGIGVFPIAAATTGNLAGFETTTTRGFCGSCHVMTPYLDDVRDSGSGSLASLHGRSQEFGPTACYSCHADYGMYGTVATKIGGLKHVWAYYIEGYSDLTLEEARGRIHLYKPFPNSTCTHCHSTLLPGWLDEPEHLGLEGSLQNGEVSCASPGCHGPAHPFSKNAAVGP